ncbi:MAG TPA: hypothetical protein VGR53_07040 [Nitrososphaerales archaeon]|nr:hypothetical protein [Nitrososphaerales archaeon]
MTSRNSLYGLVVVATALIIISATFGGYYYLQASTAASNNSKLIAELNSANSNYTKLASSFNSLISSYNESIFLLSSTIAVINTSLPIYKQSSLELGALWQTYQSLTPVSTSLFRNSVLFDFGNGTHRWFNDSAIDAGWNLYIETVVLNNGHVDAQWYPQYGEHLVNGIGGISNTATKFWFLWSYNNTAGWQPSRVGADGILVTSGSVYGWTFCTADPNFNPVCRP